MSLRGILSIPNAFIVSVLFRSFFTLSTIVDFKKKNNYFLVPMRCYFIFYLLDAGVIPVQVYNMLNFICAVYAAYGGDSFRINSTAYLSNIYIIAIK